MTTTTYTVEVCNRRYMNGFFENVTVDNGKYTIDAFVGRIDYVKRDAIAQCANPHKNYESPYTVIDWLGYYTVVVYTNDENTTKIHKEFYNLKDAVDFYLSFERGSYCEKVIYQKRQLGNGEYDHNVVTYA